MWTVHVGITQQLVPGAQSLAVERIIYHARYRPKGLDYDVALMKLAVSLVFSGTVVFMYIHPLSTPVSDQQQNIQTALFLLFPQGT